HARATRRTTRRSCAWRSPASEEMSGEATDDTVLRPCDIEPRSPLRRQRELGANREELRDAGRRRPEPALARVSRRWDDRLRGAHDVQQPDQLLWPAAPTRDLPGQ